MNSRYLKAFTSRLKKVIFAYLQIALVRREKELNTHPRKHKRPNSLGENIITAIAVGTVLILIGTIYVATLPTSLFGELKDFFGAFTTSQVGGTGLYLPVPAVPAAHAVLYNAAFQFCIGLAILQIIVLLLRLMFHSSIGKISETTGNLVFWFGVSYLVATFLNGSTTAETWFSFWAAIIIATGISMIARALVFFAEKRS